MRFQICVRSQHAKRGQSGWAGPDTYVAVLTVPEGVEAPYNLNRRVLALRGIKMWRVGEGYSRHSGPRSSLGQALIRAQAYVDEMREAAQAAACSRQEIA